MNEAAKHSAFVFDNTYARELEGFYVPWQGASVPTPEILRFNDDLARELGVGIDTLNSPDGAEIFAGSTAPLGANPLAQAYAGHQFGGFSPQLGDGRALLIGEVIDTKGKRRDIHLKGSGKTPFSRGGDGKAVLGPVLREYLMGEAMHGLGIPTTRALAAVTTGENIMRDGPEPGAVLARVASSHLRVGTFQFFAARQENARVKTLADYAIARHYPDLADTPDQYLAFLNAVIATQARLVAAWMQVGFIHGVMNTDNTTISGETIDYGPCAFMDHYDPKTVFSSIDAQGRYAYGNQPAIAAWNLARLAETLLPLIHPDNADEAVRLATEAINGFMPLYESALLEGMRGKLGLANAEIDDQALVDALFAILLEQNVDFTSFFRALPSCQNGGNDAVSVLFRDPSAPLDWLDQWRARISREAGELEDRTASMNAINPIYIPRNHKVEEALQAATKSGDMAPFDELLSLVKKPFIEVAGKESFAGPAPSSFGHYTTYCGT